MKKILIFICNRFMWLAIIFAVGVFTCKSMAIFMALFISMIFVGSYIIENCRLTISEIKTKEFIKELFFSEE